MSPQIACLADRAVYRLREQGLFRGKTVGRRATPFGASEVIFLVEDAPEPFYLIAQHGARDYELSPTFINHRANLYALKDLGVGGVIAFAGAGAISHNFNVGDLVLVSDLIDRTTRRATTFFENSGIGPVRQFPVFCPSLRQAMADCLTEMHSPFHATSTLVVTEGPRLETPAEIRFLASAGGELVSHHLAPEAFLAKELELCFAGVIYVANYAETGSSYLPFSSNDLFGGLASPNNQDRLAHALETIAQLTYAISQYAHAHPRTCQCDQTMRHNVEKFHLSDDWRQWFPAATGTGAGAYEKNPPAVDRLKRLAGQANVGLEIPPVA